MTRVILASLVSLLLIQEGDPATEYKNGREAIGKMIATKHVGIGEYLHGQTMHGWARDQFNAAIAADPNCEQARKRLGDKRSEDGQSWEPDPSNPPQLGNKKTKEDDVIKVKTEYEKKLADAGKTISNEWTRLGNLADKAAMKDAAVECWKKAVEWNAGNESARKKLGHEKTKEGFWVSPGDKKLRSALSDDLAKAPKGAEDKGASDVGGKLSLTMARRTSENFTVESSYLDQKTLEGLVQLCEHSFAMFHQFFNQTKLFPEKYTITILKDKSQHEKYVDAFDTGATPAQKEFSKKSSGMGGFPRSECYTGDRPNSSNEDYCIHYPIQNLVGAVAGHGALWMLEGTALWFSARIKTTAHWACVDLAGTGAGGSGKNYQDPKNWPFVIKTWLKEGKDPAMEGLIKCIKWSELDGAETVKAWSVVDFLLTEHKEKFIEFMQAQKSEKDSGEAAFKKVWGWSIADLDTKWKAWARSAYEGTK